MESDSCVALVTGAGRGIGLELCRQLQKQGQNVIAVTNGDGAAPRELGVEVVAGIDLTEDQGRRSVLEALRDRKVGLLVNSAGIVEPNDLAGLDEASVMKQFQINALAPILLARELLPHLYMGTKLVFLTSRMGSIGDNTSGGHYGYRASKAALNVMLKSLSVDLKPLEVCVGIIHPGLVQTRMTGFTGRSAEVAVQEILQRISELDLEKSGIFFHADGSVLPW